MIFSWSIAISLGFVSAPLADRSPLPTSSPTIVLASTVAPEDDTTQGGSQPDGGTTDNPAADSDTTEGPAAEEDTTGDEFAEPNGPAQVVDDTSLPAEPTEPPPATEPAVVAPIATTDATTTTTTGSESGQAEITATSDTAEDSTKPKKDKLKHISFSIGGRVMAGFEYETKRPSEEQTANAGSSHEFFLRQARVKFGIDYKKIFRIRGSVELADALKNFNVDRIAYLRNGYGEARFHKAARLRFGYFKRPFSRLELRSPTDLPFRGRGLANGRIIEDRNYGDRSVGGMLHGKVDAARLRYSAGVFAPAVRSEGIDVVGRLRADPWDWLSIGAGGLYKRIENGTGDTVNVAGASGDLHVEYKGFQILTDFIMAQDYLVPGEPWSLGIVGYAQYDIDLPKKFVLQPVVLSEWSDIDIGVSQNDAVRAVAGVNLIWRKRFRVMPQAEFIRPLGTTGNPWVEKDTYYLMLALSL